MAEIKTIMNDIFTGLSQTVNDCSMKVVYPQGADSFIVTGADGSTYMEFIGENKGCKVEYSNERISLYGAAKEGEILPGDYAKLTMSLFEPDNATQKDIKYCINDFSDTMIEFFGTKTQKPVKTKLPTPVSKAQAKSGTVSYDSNTLANRFTVIFPELREEYKANCEKYGQFLPEDFFVNHGNTLVLDTIKENNPAKMKRLFNLLNDIYADGTNETQGVICVTILGTLENNQDLLANCVDYMSEDLAPAVINVNKFLWSRDGKGARMKLENPPIYKPKKVRKFNPQSLLGN